MPTTTVYEIAGIVGATFTTVRGPSSPPVDVETLLEPSANDGVTEPEAAIERLAVSPRFETRCLTIPAQSRSFQRARS